MRGFGTHFLGIPRSWQLGIMPISFVFFSNQTFRSESSKCIIGHQWPSFSGPFKSCPLTPFAFALALIRASSTGTPISLSSRDHSHPSYARVPGPDLHRCQRVHGPGLKWQGAFLKVKKNLGYLHTLDRKSVTPLLDPIVNVSCKNCCVGSLTKIFHPNMRLIYFNYIN